jgi:hypothetical protein
MASRMLLKIKINQSLPLRFLPKSNSILTRSIAPIAKPDAPLLGGMTHNLFARQMGTSRLPATPRGSHRVSDEKEEDEDEDFDGDNDDEFDDDVDTFDIDENDLDDDDGFYENDLDDDDQDEVEEVAPKKNKFY